MRRFRDIVENIKAPSPQSLWLNNGKLKAYGANGWASIVGEGDEDRRELEEKVDNLDKEVGNIQKDVAVLNSKAVIELEIGNSESVKASNLAKLQAIQSVDHLFFADIDYGYGAARWLPSIGGEAFIITSKGISVTYIISSDGSVTKKEEIDIPKLKEDIDNKITITDDVILDLLSYGVYWNTDVADPALTRVGNMTYHRTLPIQNNMKGCIAQMKGGVKIMYYLNETDWRFRTSQDARSYILKDQVISLDGDKHTITNDVFSTLQYEYQYIKVNGIICQVSSINTETKTADITPEKALTAGSYDVELGAVLNGYDGEVMVEVPEFWIKSWYTDTRREVRISPSKIDDTWEHQPKILISPYHDTVLNRVPTDMGYLSTLEIDSAISVCNIHDYCRGGINDKRYDKYITTDVNRSMLGKPRTNISRDIMRANCRRSGKEILSYLQYKRVLYWLYVIEYANFNSQGAFNPKITPDGFKQGGLGDNVNGLKSDPLFSYNNQTSVVTNGYTNEFGNGTNIKPLKLVIPNTDSNEATTIIQDVSRWHGIETPFSDIWLNVDGVIIVPNDTLYNSVYATDNPLFYSDNDFSNMEIVGLEYLEEGYIKEFNLGNTAEIIPILMNGSVSTYKCDYHWIIKNNLFKTILFGGCSIYGSGLVGFGSFDSRTATVQSKYNIGFRSSCVVA